MELYKLIATINNTSTTSTFDFLPENFEGMKISQKFSFQNPIGYTPKFSVDTMRIIKGDKIAIDAIFDEFGLESDVQIEIKKLKAVGFGYDSLSTFAIDFESYEKFDNYSEFALKSISVFDTYNKIKNTEIQIPLTESATLPATQKYINYVSLRMDSFFTFGSNLHAMTFVENNTSKIYNDDTSLMDVVIGSTTLQNAAIYTFSEATADSQLKLKLSGVLHFDMAFSSSHTITAQVKLYKVSSGSQSVIASIYEHEYVPGSYDAEINISEIDLGGATFADGDSIVIIATYFRTWVGAVTFNVSGSFFADLKVNTTKLLFSDNSNIINHKPITDVLTTIFGESTGLISDYSLTSANHLTLLESSAIIKPKDFLSEICASIGLVVNFKNDNSVKIEQIKDYFDLLLDIDNAIEVDAQDVSVKFSNLFNYVSVTAGQEAKEYDVYTYPIDWNKPLTFSQENRNASENISFSPSKYRVDFSGILDAYLKRSQQKGTSSKDNFIFNPAFAYRSAGDLKIYDWLTPRDIITHQKKFLSFAFQNFGKNRLIISSNGGTSDNLEIGVTGQMDDVVFAEIPRLLPIEYNFTCLLDSVDFSESILKINHNGEDVYLFVFEAETTDKLSEQKIKALKIQF